EEIRQRSSLRTRWYSGFFFQAEDGIRDGHVTGVQTCALPISRQEEALSWRAPREGLFLACGPLLAPVAALGLLPLAAQGVRSLPRRALQVGAAVLLAALVAGLRHSPLPFTSAPPPKGLGIAGSEAPFAVAAALWRALTARPWLLLEAVALTAAAVALPFARERGLWGIAGLGAGLIAVTLLPA